MNTVSQHTDAQHKDVQQLLKDQALSGEVNNQIRHVIKAAAQTVQKLKPTDETTSSGMRENQLRNVVNVAISAQSVEEVAAFILYQMGRSTNRRQWLYGDFGDQVVHDLMSGAVRQAAQEAHKKAMQHINKIPHMASLTPEETQALLDMAHIRLARQYLGYLNRLFYFADSEKKGQPADRDKKKDKLENWDKLNDLLQT